MSLLVCEWFPLVQTKDLKFPCGSVRRTCKSLHVFVKLRVRPSICNGTGHHEAFWAAMDQWIIHGMQLGGLGWLLAILFTDGE